MTRKVVKKSGQIEDYNEEKIKKSLEKACKDANIPEYRKNEIINNILDTLNIILKDRDVVKTYEIREIILAKLDEIEPSVADCWRNYEESQK